MNKNDHTTSENSDIAQTFMEKYYLPVVILGMIVAALVAAMPWMGEVGVANPKTAETGGLWMNFLGRFHPLILHLPIGAVMLVLCMEGLSLVTKGKYKSQTTLAVAFAAVTAVVAVVLGYFWYLTGNYVEDEISEHKRDGVIFSVLMIITFLVKFTYDAKDIKALKPGYYVLLALSAVTMMSAGHHGGEMIHGDPLNSFPSKVAAERESKLNAPVAVDPVIYTNIVHNILENKCISCHGPDKEKGGLRLDSLAAMLDGGEEEDCLVKGDVESSFMITSFDLPEDNDMHMPPKEKPQITPEEKAILIWWIEMGAPEDKKLSEVEVPKNIATALLTLKTPEQLAAEEKAKRDAEIAVKKALADKRENLRGAWTKINAKFPGSLRYRSQQEPVLSFTAVSYRKDFVDANLAILDDVAADVVEMDLSETRLTDAGVAKLAHYSSLEKLKLNGTGITNESLKVLAKLPNLKSLNVYGTTVDDAGIEYFSDHVALSNLYLWNTNVTEAGAKKLQDTLIKRSKESGESPKVKPSVNLGSPITK